MTRQRERTLQEALTTLSPEEVLAAAKVFFTLRNRLYATFLEKEGPTFVNFRGQGGEELVVGVATAEGGTRVTGTTYMFDAQVARFLASLPPVGAAEVA